MRLTFSVATHPQAKERARRSPGGFWYTPTKTKLAEKQLAQAFVIAKNKAIQLPTFPIRGAVLLSVDCKCKTKNKKLLGKWKTTRCDVDNIAKTVCDSLNGLAYIDDGQVADLRVIKRFWHENVITVTIEELCDDDTEKT